MNTDIIIIEEVLIEIKRCSGINRPLMRPVVTVRPGPSICADPAILVTHRENQNGHTLVLPGVNKFEHVPCAY